MKKLLLTLCLTALVSLAFTSCKKDDAKLQSLAGTTWSTPLEAKRVWTFYFRSANVGTYTFTDKGYDQTYTTGFTYSYTYPTVTMTADDDTLTGTVSGNTITISGVPVPLTKRQ